MTRWIVVVAGCTLAAAAFYTASANTADAACTADPPGVAMPEHDSRSLELHGDGWSCVLRDNGGKVAVARLGWWPNDPTAAWADFPNQQQLRRTDLS